MAIHEEIIIDVTDNGMAEATKQANALASATKKVSDTTKEMGKEMQGAGNSVLDNGGAMGLLNDATGGYAMMVKDAVEASALFTKSQRIAAIQQKVMSFAVGTSTGAMKAFRLALIGTGIGAIVVALGLLIANFDKVKNAVLNLVPGLATISDAIGGLVETVTDFIGVTSEASRTLDKMVSDSEASLKRNEHFLEANGDKFDEYTNRKIKANIDYNKKVKELAADESLTEQEKIKRLKDFRDKADREILQADADRQAKLQKARDEEAQKIAENNKKIADERKRAREEQRKREEEEAAARKAALDAALKEQQKETEQRRVEALNAQDEAQEALNARFLSQQELEIQAVNDKYFALIESAKQFGIDTTALEQEQANQINDINVKFANEASDRRKKEAEEQMATDKAVQDNKFNVASQTLDLIGSLAKEGSDLAKGVAVAQATMDTYKGAVAAYAAGSSVGGPAGLVLGPVMAGLAVAAGLANIKKILATKPIEKGTPSAAGAAGTAPAAPSFNLVQGTGANQIAQSINTQQQPVQAFVVSSNVTTAQSMDRNIVENSSL